MLTRHRPAGAVATLLAATLAACATSGSGGGQGGGDTYDPTVDVPGIETVLDIVPRRLSPGDSARIILKIANTSDDDVKFRFADSRPVGLLVFGDGELQHIDGHSVPVPVYLSLGTFEEWEYVLDWDGKVEYGGRRIALVPGVYEIRVGLRRAGELYVNRSNAVEIEMAGP